MFNKIINEFNKKEIRYCVLRIGGDIDISIHKDDWDIVDEIFREHGFIRSIQNFNKNHRGYKYKDIGFDVRHLDDWNGIFYLDDNIYNNRVLKDNVYYPNKEDLLVHYICHCLLGKREWKYKLEITDLLKKVNKEEVIKKLSKVYSETKANEMIDDLKIEVFHKDRFFVIEAILTHLYVFTKTTFSWLKWLIRPYPLIAIIGPDGSGKSTTAKNLTKKIEEYMYPVEYIYAGRGQKNVLPVNSIGSRIKRRPKWLYLPYSVFSFLDLIIRYYFTILPKRYDSIIVTDRSYLDILTMKNIPMLLKRFYLLFFPKPDKVFYLYNTIEVLHKRRPEHDVEDLKRQMKIFDVVNATAIKTTSEEQTLKEILRRIF